MRILNITSQTTVYIFQLFFYRWLKLLLHQDFNSWVFSIFRESPQKGKPSLFSALAPPKLFKREKASSLFFLFQTCSKHEQRHHQQQNLTLHWKSASTFRNLDGRKKIGNRWPRFFFNRNLSLAMQSIMPLSHFSFKLGVCTPSKKFPQSFFYRRPILYRRPRARERERER